MVVPVIITFQTLSEISLIALYSYSDIFIKEIYILVLDLLFADKIIVLDEDENSESISSDYDDSYASARKEKWSSSQSRSGSSSSSKSGSRSGSESSDTFFGSGLNEKLM